MSIDEPQLHTVRQSGNRTAILFIHGFTGSAQSTWGTFPELVASEPSLRSWDVFSLGYDTRLFFSGVPFWSGVPPIQRLADLLKTYCARGDLSAYEGVCIVSHSMGGLVAQRAVCDDADLRRRLTHLIFFGTPSAGLVRASWGWWINRQVRDLAQDSHFIQCLNKDRNSTFAAPSFSVVTVAGDRDEFVPPESSLGPFKNEYCAVVPGDHLSIVKPDSDNHPSLKLFVNTLNGTAQVVQYADCAAVALERNKFSEVIRLLSSHVAELDEASLVRYALALSETGEQEEAIKVLQIYGGKLQRTDAMGTLAGRLKRRWRLLGKEADARGAWDLYKDAYALSAESVSPDQAYYHAINMSYLELAMGEGGTKARESAAVWADNAIKYANGAVDSYWKLATIGEAHLIQGDLDRALVEYQSAVECNPSPREINSTLSQALHITALLYGDNLEEGSPSSRIVKIFRANIE